MGRFIGTGTDITFPSGFTACITEVSGPSASRESIDFTCMDDSSAREFFPSKLVDWGEVTVSIAFNPGEANLQSMLHEDPDEYTIDWADSVDSSASDNRSWSFDAFCTGIDPTAPLEDKATADVTLKITKGVTRS